MEFCKAAVLNLLIYSFALLLMGCNSSDSANYTLTQLESEFIQVDPDDLDETCDRSGMPIVLGCEYFGAGPLGFSIGMDVNELAIIFSIINKLHDSSIGLRKNTSKTGYDVQFVKEGAKIEDIEEILYWANEISVPHRQYRRNGFLTVTLKNGVVDSIRWGWSLDMP